MDLFPLVFIVALAAIWVLQSIFVYRQGKAFMRRIHELRGLGRVAVGVGYSRFRLRTFIVVVADRQDRVVRVERLSGLTIFAQARPINRYAGLHLAELVDVAAAQRAPRQIVAALRQAVDALRADKAGGEPAADAAPDGPAGPPSPRGEEGGVPISQAI